MRLWANKKGFTLVEVLVSLVVLTLLMLATVTAMRTFGKTQIAMEKVARRSDEVRLVSRFLRNSLEAMLPSAAGSSGGLSTGGGPTDSDAYFAGTGSALEWHGPMLIGEAFGGTLALRLVWQEQNLVLHWLDILPFGQVYGWENAETKLLLENVNSFTVQYRAGFGEDWIESWESKPGAPVAISINLGVDGRYWPELIIALP